MRFELRLKDEVWTPRGRPGREIPDQVRHLADQTYRTGKVVVVEIDPDEEQEARELQLTLRAYAKQRKLHMRIQRDGDLLKFEMCDVKPRGD